MRIVLIEDSGIRRVFADKRGVSFSFKTETDCVVISEVTEFYSCNDVREKMTVSRAVAIFKSPRSVMVLPDGEQITPSE